LKGCGNTLCTKGTALAVSWKITAMRAFAVVIEGRTDVFTRGIRLAPEGRLDASSRSPSRQRPGGPTAKLQPSPAGLGHGYATSQSARGAALCAPYDRKSHGMRRVPRLWRAQIEIVPQPFRVCGRTNNAPTFVREPGRTAGPSAPPDFLSKIVASLDLMRLSLRRAT
jgi:hypothetical protein